MAAVRACATTPSETAAVEPKTSIEEIVPARAQERFGGGAELTRIGGEQQRRPLAAGVRRAGQGIGEAVTTHQVDVRGLPPERDLGELEHPHGGLLPACSGDATHREAHRGHGRLCLERDRWVHRR